MSSNTSSLRTIDIRDVDLSEAYALTLAWHARGDDAMPNGYVPNRVLHDGRIVYSARPSLRSAQAGFGEVAVLELLGKQVQLPLQRDALFYSIIVDDASSFTTPTKDRQLSEECLRELDAVLRVHSGETFEDGKQSVLGQRIKALVSIYGKTVIQILPHVLRSQSSSPAVVGEILLNIAEIADTGTTYDRLKLLGHYLQDEAPFVRYAAAMALAEMRDRRALPVLVARTDEKNALVLEALRAAIAELSRD